jgi:hypothetical protein
MRNVMYTRTLQATGMRPAGNELAAYAARVALRAERATSRPSREAAWLRYREAAEYQQLRDEAEAARRAADAAHNRLRRARALLPAWQAREAEGG